MKTLFEIVTEDQEGFNQEEVNQYIDNFIRKYDAADERERIALGAILHIELLEPLKEAMEGQTNNEEKEALILALGRAVEAVGQYNLEKYRAVHEQAWNEMKQDWERGVHNHAIRNGPRYINQFVADAKNYLITCKIDIEQRR